MSRPQNKQEAGRKSDYDELKDAGLETTGVRPWAAPGLKHPGGRRVVKRAVRRAARRAGKDAAGDER